MCDSLREIAVILLLFIGLGVELSAQHPIVRLSRDLPMPELPGTIRIQAAASLGTRTLVLWGSTRRAPDDSIRPLLYGQIVAGGRALGTPTVISLDDADPTTYVAVIPLRDRFLAVWTELAKGVLRTRARVVGLDGALGVDFLLMDSGRVVPDPTAIRRGNGTRLLWNDTLSQPLAHALDLDSQGRPAGSRTIAGSYRVGGIVGRLEEEGLSILDRADQPPLLLDDAGNATELSPRQLEKLSAPYDIGRDGTLVTLADSTARFYNSPLDTVPYRTLIVRVPAGSYRAALIPSLDSLGRLQVSYLRAVKRPTEIDGSQWLHVYLNRITNIRDSTFGDSVIAGSGWGARFGAWRNQLQIVITTVRPTRECRGQYALNYSLEVTWRDYSQGTSESGVLLDSGTIDDRLDPRFCGREADVQLSRINREGSSVTLAARPGHSLILTAPSATLPRNVAESVPGIRVVDGTLVVGFISSAAIPMAPLIRWNPRSDQVDSLGLMRPSWLGSTDSSRWGMNASLTMVRAADRFLICQSRAWYQRQPGGDTVARGSLTFFAPTARGWGAPVAQAPLAQYRLSLPWLAMSDPDAGTCMIVAGLEAYPPVQDVVSLGRDNSLRWSVERGITGLNEKGTVMPGDSDMFRIYDTRSYWRFVRGVRDSILDRAVAPGNYRFERLFGGATLGITRSTPNAMMLFGRDGERLLPADVAGLATENAVDACILQSPADSSIVMIYSTSRGIRVTRADRRLNSLGRDTLVIPRSNTVTSPTAAFLGDSLAVVWVEQRYESNGVASTDVFGTIIPLTPPGPPPTLGVHTDPFPHSRSLLHPNPADGMAMLRRADASRSEEIVITDMMGRMVFQDTCDAGTEVVSIGTATWAQGAYTMRVVDRTRIGRDSQRVDDVQLLIVSH